MHRVDIMSTMGGYHEYTGRCSAHREDIMSTPGRYHDKCRGRSLGKQLNLFGNPGVLNIPMCTHDIPHTHHGIPQCTAQILCRVVTYEMRSIFNFYLSFNTVLSFDLLMVNFRFIRLYMYIHVVPKN